ncbi:MAG: fibronectin type III domain-containing protein [Planctomycetota bacterium]|nr:MAG: fibronectin type III domain-containing protein [Planctomycetota bacterium]
MDMMHGTFSESVHGITAQQTAPGVLSRLARIAFLGLSLFVLLGGFNVMAGELVYTGRHALKIPFDFKDDQIKQLRATEVQLLVSMDNGKSWKTAARAKPQDRVFRYNAQDNGEYWFAVRMMNSQNQPVQPGAPQVGLKVKVDDVPPVLELMVRELSPGRVELTWQVEDDALNIDTLEVQYREGEGGEWKPLNTDSQNNGRVDIPVTGSGMVYVAARVSDLAKNEVTAESQTSVSGSEKSSERVTEPDFSKPVAIIPNLVNPIPATTYPNGVGQLTQDAASNVPLPRIITDGSSSAQPTTQNVSQHAGSPGVANPPPTKRSSPFPAGAKLVKSNSFNIGYSLDQVGPSGVGAVDLYITEDDGRSWFHYGSDPDRKSPFSVRVEKSGQYGFAIRARSGIGLSDDPPQPGNRPEIIVVVDDVAPRPRLGSLNQGQGVTHNQVMLSWVLLDGDLPEQSVMLSRAYSPTGPWEPISGWIENTGRYLWSVDQTFERPVYIRIEARDLAGNIGKADSDQPLHIDLTRPTARILDVETVTQ